MLTTAVRSSALKGQQSLAWGNALRNEMGNPLRNETWGVALRNEPLRNATSPFLETERSRSFVEGCSGAYCPPPNHQAFTPPLSTA